MGSGPKASDPPDHSARRLRGRPDPSTRGLPDPMAPDPKTEFHDAMVKQNSRAYNTKFQSGGIFLWIISQYFHKLSTYYPEKDFLILFHAVAVIVEVLQSTRFEDSRVAGISINNVMGAGCFSVLGAKVRIRLWLSGSPGSRSATEVVPHCWTDWQLG